LIDIDWYWLYINNIEPYLWISNMCDQLLLTGHDIQPQLSDPFSGWRRQGEFSTEEAVASASWRRVSDGFMVKLGFFSSEEKLPSGNLT